MEKEKFRIIAGVIILVVIIAAMFVTVKWIGNEQDADRQKAIEYDEVIKYMETATNFKIGETFFTVISEYREQRIVSYDCSGFMIMEKNNVRLVVSGDYLKCDFSVSECFKTKKELKKHLIDQL